MLEFIRTLIEGIVSAAPNIKGVRDARKRRRLGADLFVLYARLNQVVVDGEVIVDELEARVTDPGGVLAPLYISRVAADQAENLTRIIPFLRDHSVVMTVVAPDAANRLVSLVDGKTQALSMLIAGLQISLVPLAPSREQIEQLANERAHALRSPERFLQAKAELIEAMERSSVDAGPWDSSTQQRVAEHLDIQRPRELLAEMRSSLSALRAALLEHFSLEDILIDVRERSRKDGWHAI
ncbi:hypothetical protein ACWDSL_06350 [Streptomyces sp. NPDC000941]